MHADSLDHLTAQKVHRQLLKVVQGMHIRVVPLPSNSKQDVPLSGEDTQHEHVASCNPNSF